MAMAGAMADQVVIVTGAGRGIGEATALHLAKLGAKVLVNDLDADATNAVVTAVREAGGSAEASVANVATREGGAAIAEAAVDAFGRIDALVNNAGSCVRAISRI